MAGRFGRSRKNRREKRQQAERQQAERQKRLYKEGAEPAELRKFKREYGKEKGRQIYGATVGKVHREQEKHHKKARRLFHRIVTGERK